MTWGLSFETVSSITVITKTNDQLGRILEKYLLKNPSPINLLPIIWNNHNNVST